MAYLTAFQRDAALAPGLRCGARIWVILALLAVSVDGFAVVGSGRRAQREPWTPVATAAGTSTWRGVALQARKKAVADEDDEDDAVDDLALGLGLSDGLEGDGSDDLEAVLGAEEEDVVESSGKKARATEVDLGSRATSEDILRLFESLARDLKGAEAKEVKAALEDADLGSVKADIPLAGAGGEDDAEEVMEPAGAVDPSEAYRMMTEEDAVYLDVRQKEEFVHGHPAGAVNVPFGRFDRGGLAERGGFAYDVLSKYPADTLFCVGCQGSRRSTDAARKLAAAGMEDVYIVMGGFGAWALLDELPVASSYGARALEVAESE